MAYVAGSGPESAGAPVGCIFCHAVEQADDRPRFVLRRGTLAYLILNAYPYTPGHLMAVANRHIPTIADATAAERAELMDLVALATAALGEEYGAHGYNIGINQGRVAGAGIEGHLHVHVVPRWNGDVNFMPVLGDVRVLPESLDATWDRLRSRLG
jgi:ATP adenylyltransferase